MIQITNSLIAVEVSNTGEDFEIGNFEANPNGISLYYTDGRFSELIPLPSGNTYEYICLLSEAARDMNGLSLEEDLEIADSNIDLTKEYALIRITN